MGDRDARRVGEAAEVVHGRGEHPRSRRRSGGLGVSGTGAGQTLTFFTDRGIAYTMRVNDIPMTTGHGDPIQKQFAFEDQEHIVAIVMTRDACRSGACGRLRFVQRMLERPRRRRCGGRRARAGAQMAMATARRDRRLPAAALRDRAFGGGKVLRMALQPLAAVSTRKGGW